MLNQTTSFLNIFSKSVPTETLCLVYQIGSMTDSYSKSPIQIRIYCLHCGHTELKGANINPHFFTGYTIFSLIHPKGSPVNEYVCPRCQQRHHYQFQHTIQVKERSSVIDRWKAISCLSEITNEGKTLMAQHHPDDFKRLNRDKMAGYQLTRYQMTVFIHPQTLEIQPVELKGTDVYFYLEDGTEIAYQERKGQITKQEPFLACLNYYEHLNDWLDLEGLTPKNIAHRTGLFTYLNHFKDSTHGLKKEFIPAIYRYEHLRKDYPCIEQLTKAGYFNFIKSLLETEVPYAHYQEKLAKELLNPNGSNPSQILGFSKGVLKKLTEWNVFDNATNVEQFKQLHQQFPLTFTVLTLIEDHLDWKELIKRQPHLTFLLSKNYTYQELIRYCSKHLESLHELYLLKDYVSMSEEMEVEYERFPKDIVAAHDRIKEQFQLKEDEITQQKFSQVVHQVKPLEYLPAHGDYFMKVPNQIHELVREGEALSHCVASYAKPMAAGETTILFLRKKAEPSQPFITVEWCQGEIIQAHGKYNRSIENYPEAHTFLNEWVEYAQSIQSCEGL